MKLHRLGAFSFALILSAAWLSFASPMAASVTCNSNYDEIGSGLVNAVIYESHDYNAGQDGAHSGGLCIRYGTTSGINIPDLKNVNYRNPLDTGFSHICDGQLISSYGTWNDCAGSLKVTIDCHHTISFYSSANYDGLMWSYGGENGNNPGPWGMGWDNVMSSIRVIYHSACISSPIYALG